MGTDSTHSARRQSGTTYKFQRLRERIRQAIQNGELQGKLPGERTLARRFHSNAKTVSKALTDLAAEGLLERSIGRGSYVHGSAPPPPAVQGRWLVLCDSCEDHAAIVECLRQVRPNLQTLESLNLARPSFLNQFTAVIDLGSATPEASLRGLLVRNIPVIVAGGEPRRYSVNAALPDHALSAARLTRDLLIAGHRHLGAVEPAGGDAIAQAMRRSASCFPIQAKIESSEPARILSLVERGATALVCRCQTDARDARAVLNRAGIRIPEQVSLGAVGCASDVSECSGYFIGYPQLAEAVVAFLREPPARPVTLWLTGAWSDRGTVGPYPGARPTGSESSPPLAELPA